jgi:hypothetical protein
LVTDSSLVSEFVVALVSSVACAKELNAIAKNKPTKNILKSCINRPGIEFNE